MAFYNGASGAWPRTGLHVVGILHERSQQWLIALHGKTLPVTLFGLEPCEETAK